MPKDKDGLTPKQARFVLEYLIDSNATQAAIRAGYSPKTAAQESSRLLTNVKIAQAVQEGQSKVANELGISVEWVARNLKTVAERCLEAMPATDSEGNELGFFTFRPSGANKALELLGKHLGMFGDKLDLTSNGQQIVGITVIQPVQDSRRSLSKDRG